MDVADANLKHRNVNGPLLIEHSHETIYTSSHQTSTHVRALIAWNPYSINIPFCRNKLQLRWLNNSPEVHIRHTCYRHENWCSYTWYNQDSEHSYSALWTRRPNAALDRFIGVVINDPPITVSQQGIAQHCGWFLFWGDLAWLLQHDSHRHHSHFLRHDQAHKKKTIPAGPRELHSNFSTRIPYQSKKTSSDVGTTWRQVVVC